MAPNGGNFHHWAGRAACGGENSARPGRPSYSRQPVARRLAVGDQMTAAAPVRVISMRAPTVTTVERSRVEQLLEPTLFYGTFALLAFGPLAFGAVQPWAIFTLELGAAVLFLAWSIKQLLPGAVTIRSSPAFAPMLLFLIVATGQLLSGTTAYRYATATQIAQYLAYGALSFVALQVLGSPHVSVRFARLLSWFGFAV